MVTSEKPMTKNLMDGSLCMLYQQKIDEKALNPALNVTPYLLQDMKRLKCEKVPSDTGFSELHDKESSLSETMMKNSATVRHLVLVIYTKFDCLKKEESFIDVPCTIKM